MATLPPVLNKSLQLGRRGVVEGRALSYAWRAGMIGADPPSRTLAVFRALDRLGQLGGAIAVAAIRHGDRVGLIDELGTLTFAELDARSDALAMRAARPRGRGRGRGRDPVPQPPRVPRHHVRRREGRATGCCI